MPRAGKKESAPTMQANLPLPSTEEMRTRQRTAFLYTIMDAILNAIKTCGNPEPGSECQTIHSSGHQVTCRNANTHATHSHSNTACTVPCETKCEHAITLVLLDQSSIEIISLPEPLPLTVTLNYLVVI